MKKQPLYIALFLIIGLSIYAIYLYYNDDPTSIKKPNSNFTIKNIEDIDRIFIKDVTNEEANLSKIDGVWYVNDKFKARPENIELILETVKNIEVQRSVPKEAIQPVITDIAALHKKVDFYANGELIKTYFIGNPTQDHYGTYMLLETPSEGRSTVPYITHMPGFNGFLSTRFFANESLWKYTGVFNYEIANIQQVSVTNSTTKNESFDLKSTDTSFALYNFSGNQILENQSLVKNYILNYKKIHYNAIMEYTQKQIDSVKQLVPHFVVTVLDKAGKENQLKVYKKAARSNDMDPITGNQRKWDVNHALACLNNNNEILKFQYFTLDKILVDKSYLKSN